MFLAELTDLGALKSFDESMLGRDKFGKRMFATEVMVLSGGMPQMEDGRMALFR